MARPCQALPAVLFRVSALVENYRVINLQLSGVEQISNSKLCTRTIKSGILKRKLEGVIIASVISTKRPYDTMNLIEWDDFERVQLCAGTIVEVEEFPEARKPAYKLTIDFGEEIGRRRSSAQITTLYERESLIGKQIMAVVNFPKKQIGPFMSECLVTGMAREDGAIVLVSPDAEVPNGARLC